MLNSAQGTKSRYFAKILLFSFFYLFIDLLELKRNWGYKFSVIPFGIQTSDEEILASPSFRFICQGLILMRKEYLKLSRTNLTSFFSD